MPAPIYLPQDPSTLGAIMNPAMQQGGSFLWNLLGQNINYAFNQRLANIEAKSKYDAETRRYAHEEKLQRRRIQGEKDIAETKRKTPGPDIRTYILPDGSPWTGDVTKEKVPTGAIPAQYHKEYGKRPTSRPPQPKDPRTKEKKIFDDFRQAYVDRYGEMAFRKNYPAGYASWYPMYLKEMQRANMWSVMGGGNSGFPAIGQPQTPPVGGWKGPGTYQDESGKEIYIPSYDDYKNRIK